MAYPDDNTNPNFMARLAQLAQNDPFGLQRPQPPAAQDSPNDNAPSGTDMGYYTPAQALQAVQQVTPQADYGPYAPGATGETAREYQEQLNSPYLTGLARALAKHHPRVAGFVDNAVLGAEAANNQHMQALAAGGGVEGAGGGIADALAGLLGPSQMRLAHRQALEELPLQYAGQEAQAQEARARAAQEAASGAGALMRPIYTFLGQQQRGVGAEGIRAGSNEQIEQSKETNSQTLQDKKDQTAIDVAKLRKQGDEIRAWTSQGRASASLENTYQRGMQKLADLQQQILSKQVWDSGLNGYRDMTPDELSRAQQNYDDLRSQLGNVYNQAKGAARTGKINPATPAAPNSTSKVIYAQDPQGNIHTAPPGTKLPQGWKLVKKP